jgi:hypothetical protein
MYKLFFISFLLLSVVTNAQKMNKFDSTLKIGKVGFKVNCTNKNIERNVLSVKPIGFTSEAREIGLDLKGRIMSAEIDDLNQDGFPDMIIYVIDAANKISLFSISSKNNESMQPIYFPDITNDAILSKGYRGLDEYKLVEGILFRQFPIFDADTTIKTPTKKARRIMYKVMTGDKGMLNFKVIKNFEYNLD